MPRKYKKAMIEEMVATSEVAILLPGLHWGQSKDIFDLNSRSQYRRRKAHSGIPAFIIHYKNNLTSLC